MRKKGRPAVAEHAERIDAIMATHSSNRAIHTTPALRQFLERDDVRMVQFPSGTVYVFLRDRPFMGETEQEAIESAMLAELRGIV